MNWIIEFLFFFIFLTLLVSVIYLLARVIMNENWNYELDSKEQWDD